MIIPSRFGYLGTMLPADASPAEQADAYAYLLDTLSIDRAAIVGIGAGGNSAIQFALRYPGRCSALVLVSSTAPGAGAVALPPPSVAEALIRFDFLTWLLATHFPASTYPLLGVPDGYQVAGVIEAQVARTLRTSLPTNPRAMGAIFDAYVSNPDVGSYPLEEIAVPTLIIHARDDPLVPYESARAMAERIPTATMITLEDGGHLLLGHGVWVQHDTRAFLNAHRPPDRPWERTVRERESNTPFCPSQPASTAHTASGRRVIWRMARRR